MKEPKIGSFNPLAESEGTSAFGAEGAIVQTSLCCRGKCGDVLRSLQKCHSLSGKCEKMAMCCDDNSTFSVEITVFSIKWHYHPAGIEQWKSRCYI